MILTLAVAAGLPAGLLRARLLRRPFQTFDIQFFWLAVVAFAGQWLVFLSPATRHLLPDHLASIILVATQALLLVFAWSNRRQPGFWALGLGLCLNFVVIAANGGLMPISPETVRQLAPQAPPRSRPRTHLPCRKHLLSGARPSNGPAARSVTRAPCADYPQN